MSQQSSVINDALEKARAIVASHGLVKYMAGYTRNALAQPVNGATYLRYDLFLDPDKPSYASDNCSAALAISYEPNRERRDGGIYDDYTLKVSVRLNSMELRSEIAKARENMIASMLMLCDMVELVLPKKFTVTVMTAEEVVDQEVKSKEQDIARRIHRMIGKECVKNLRAGGRPKVTRIPNKYAETWGEMPKPGRYRYTDSAWSARRGSERNRKDYVFTVSQYDSEYWYVSARRVK